MFITALFIIAKIWKPPKYPSVDEWIKMWSRGEGQAGGRVGSPNHLSPPNYLENLQIILKIYEFGLRFKERPAGMLQ